MAAQSLLKAKKKNGHCLQIKTNYDVSMLRDKTHYLFYFYQ
jgi:hypothetical protein